MSKQGGKQEPLNQLNSEKKEYNEDLNGDLSNEKVTVIFLLGGPGSGKSTQSRKIVEQFGFVHISAGDLLREESKSGSENSIMIQKCMERGELVPSDLITALLQRAMEKSSRKKILIDGFPRSLENRASFETLTGIEREFVLYFDCPEDLLKQRLLKRNEGRNDDNIDTITKRFEGLKSMLSVIEFYDLKRKVHKIDAEKSVEDVFEEIKAIFHY